MQTLIGSAKVYNYPEVYQEIMALFLLDDSWACNEVVYYTTQAMV